MSNPNANSLEALRAELAKVTAERDAAIKATERSLSLRVSEKGAVSLYGMGRFPVTLYASQWAALLGHAEQIKSFIKSNESKLAVKHAARAA